MDKLVELNREYWVRVHDMCEGTTVKPWECLRIKGLEPYNDHPRFNIKELVPEYEFAVAILKDEQTGLDRPVFVGDAVYIKNNKYPSVNWELFEYWKNEISELSKDWTFYPPKPKRTFTLNGVELPCPKKGFNDGDFYMDVGLTRFVFNTLEDVKKVKENFTNLLTEARDKQ